MDKPSCWLTHSIDLCPKCRKYAYSLYILGMAGYTDRLTQYQRNKKAPRN